MKKLLAGTALATALVFGAVRSANALFGMGDIVFDPTSFAEQVRHGAEELKNQVQELFNWTEQLRWMQETFGEVSKVYDQGERMYYAVNHLTSINGIFSALNMLGIQNPLPINPQSAISLANGTGSISGMRYSIPGLFNHNYAANRLYEPTGPGYIVTEMRERATANAGMQAMSGQLYESMGESMERLRDLQSRIDGADAKDLAALHARIAFEQSYIQAKQVQATSLSMMQTAGWRAIEQRSQENMQKNIDAVMASGDDTF